MLDYDSNAAVKRAGGAFGFAYASIYLGLIYSDIFTAKNVPPPPPNIPSDLHQKTAWGRALGSYIYIYIYMYFLERM